MTLTTKSFVQDTAKLGVGRRTVERQIQIAKNLTAEAKQIIRDADAKISKKTAMKLSRLESEQQKEAGGRGHRRMGGTGRTGRTLCPLLLREQALCQLSGIGDRLKRSQQGLQLYAGYLPGRDHRLCAQVLPGDRVVFPPIMRRCFHP